MSDIVVFVRSQPSYGDQIVAFPTLYQLKQWWPQKRLRVVSRDAVGSYYTALPWVDEFVIAKSFKDHFLSVPRNAGLSVNLHHSSERYALVSLLRRLPTRLGFRNGRVCDRVWTHHHRKDIAEYIALANLRMLATLRPFHPETAALRCFQEIATPVRHTVAPADVVLIPGGAAGEFKRWSIRHYVELANLLKPRLGAGTTFTFVLGPDETVEHEMLQAMGRKDFRLEFCRTVPELVAMMLPARLIVANDCGPSHIAQGVGVPYVGIFNEPNPEWFWKRSYSADVVPTNGSSDINSIAPIQALQACMNVLSKPLGVDPYGTLRFVEEAGSGRNQSSNEDMAVLGRQQA